MVLVIVREKPVRVYVRRGLTRYLCFKGFQSYKEISLVEFSHAGLTRLIRVLFHFNARIRPSVFTGLVGLSGAFQEAS